jgi:asparagine synthetase B (glutamine-hydrolysing)
MCGIFGILPKENLNLKPAFLHQMTDNLFKLSESRGKEAAGLAIRTNQSIYVYKTPTSASRLIRSPKYKQIFLKFLNKEPALAIIGHARLVTDGAQTFNDNNQPVIKDGAVIIHNGIIVNAEALWKSCLSLSRKYEVDTEIIPALIQKFNKDGDPLIKAAQRTFEYIKGTASIALLFNNNKKIILATNTGSLYTCLNQKEDILIFASEKYILEKFAKKRYLKNLLGQYKILQLKASFGYLIDLANFEINKFSLRGEMSPNLSENFNPLEEIKIINPPSQDNPVIIQPINKKINTEELIKNFNKSSQVIEKLRRCTKCILPETMPFIEFDKQGVCNYCRNYKKIELKGKVALENFVAKYRNKNEKPDCIVCFSGGRDSSYTLHYVKKILKINPVAYSYDWGEITDLARRNQARICGKLGIEHILISADIVRKRENIRKNVKAWLKNPNLGTVPLFMAGDKQYFYYANKLKQQTGTNLIIIGTNLLEKTDFKSGFCGVKPVKYSHQYRFYALSLMNQLKLVSYYARQFLLNPTYLNSSILDTLSAFASYYLIAHNFLNIYEYIPWNENEIISTLINEYHWETSPDTPGTWRIGDGTASFYNYIYYTLAGFTENDTFRSNQIRENMISREEALRLTQEENKPRYESIKWYCDTIAIDFENTLKTINSAPKLYKI